MLSLVPTTAVASATTLVVLVELVFSGRLPVFGAGCLRGLAGGMSKSSADLVELVYGSWWFVATPGVAEGASMSTCSGEVVGTAELAVLVCDSSCVGRLAGTPDGAEDEAAGREVAPVVDDRAGRRGGGKSKRSSAEACCLLLVAVMKGSSVTEITGAADSIDTVEVDDGNDVAASLMSRGLFSTVIVLSETF